MKKSIALIATGMFLVVGLSACGSTSQPLPQGPKPVATSQAAEPAAPAAPAAKPAAAEPAPAPEPVEKASTCDIAREALLTGSATDKKNAMNALIADKTADATAREYAQYYNVRDKNDKDMQEMDKSLIQMSCG